MPVSPHPVDVSIATRDPVAIAADLKLGYRRNCADVDFVHNHDLTGQYAGIRVQSLQRNFKLDTESTADDDGGVSVIVDGAGNHWLVEPVVVELSQREVTAAGDVTVSTADNIILINKSVGADTNVLLPASADLEADELLVVDGKGDASTHRIRLVPDGTEKISLQDYFEITRDAGFARLRKLAAGGWYVAGSSE